MAVNDPSLGQTPPPADFPSQAEKPPFWKPAADRGLTQQRPGGTRFLSTPFNNAGSSSPKDGLQDTFRTGMKLIPGRKDIKQMSFSAFFLVCTLLSLWLRKQACSHLASHRSLLGVFSLTAGERRSLVWLAAQSPPRPVRSLARAGENPCPVETWFCTQESGYAAICPSAAKVWGSGKCLGVRLPRAFALGSP